MPKIKDIALVNHKFDGFEIWPCLEYIDEQNPEKSFVETCEPEDAHFWSLYVHTIGEGLQCIADCDTEEDAKQLQEWLENLLKFAHVK